MFALIIHAFGNIVIYVHTITLTKLMVTNTQGLNSVISIPHKMFTTLIVNDNVSSVFSFYVTCA